MVGTPVHMDRAPHSGFLLAWGRATDSWWGLVQFRQPVRSADGHDDTVHVAAWLPAAALTKPGWASEGNVPRVHLPVDDRAWPPPTGWPAWYAGPWPDGPLQLPAGAVAENGPAWRRRR